MRSNRYGTVRLYRCVDLERRCDSESLEQVWHPTNDQSKKSRLFGETDLPLFTSLRNVFIFTCRLLHSSRVSNATRLQFRQTWQTRIGAANLFGCLTVLKSAGRQRTKTALMSSVGSESKPQAKRRLPSRQPTPLIADLEVEMLFIKIKRWEYGWARRDD